MPSPLLFPAPVAAQPDAADVMQMIQAEMTSSLALLKRANLEDLATEYSRAPRPAREDLMARVALVHPMYRESIGAVARDYRPYARWLGYRETYDAHPQLTEALMRLEADIEVPGEVLRGLPHINPAIVMPGAPPVTLTDGKSGRVLAAFIVGAVSMRYQRPGDAATLVDAPPNGSVLVDTNDPHANALQAMVISEVHNAEGTHVVDLDTAHLTVPIREAFTLEEMVRHIALDGFHFDPSADSGDPEVRRAYLLTLSRAVVAHLLYACSRTVELDDKPRVRAVAAPRGPGQPRPPRAARVRRMGWRMGVAITDSTRRPADRPAGPGTGATRAPHWRRPHVHMYRVGPGRQGVDFKLLGAIPVNQHLDDGATITGHPMR